MLRMDSGLKMDSGLFMDEPVLPVKIKATHMRDLHIWLTNPFDDAKISMAELLSFTSDHLQRVTANPLPALTARLGPTQTALAGVSSAFTDDETQLGVRKAQKGGKNAYRAALPAGVGKIAVMVEAQFGEKSAQFVKCFPHGRSIFSTCTDDEVENNLDILINAVTSLTPPLAAGALTEATALQTGWTAVFKPSEEAGGAKTNTIAAKNAARGALQLELFRNLLVLAETFPRSPDSLDLYMQPSLLQPHTQTPATPAPSPTPPPKTP